MKKIIQLIALTLCLQACVRDMGTSPKDYIELNEVQVEGLQLYTASQPYNVFEREDGITITPRITFTKGEDNLVFEWLRADSDTPFAIGKQLRSFVPPTTWSGMMSITFRIRDTVTKVRQSRTTFYVNIVDPLRSGFWILQRDNDGYARLDMLSWISGAGNGYNRRDEESTPRLTNVLGEGSPYYSGFPKEKLIGPRKIVHFSDQVMSINFGKNAYYILTEYENTYRIHRDNFEWSEAGEIRNSFLTPSFVPANFRVDNMIAGSSSALLNSRGDLFYYSHTDLKFFSIRHNTLDGTTYFPASPRMSMSVQRFLVFDDASKSFYTLHPVRNDRCQRIDTIKERYVSYRNMNMDLVFSGVAEILVHPATSPQLPQNQTDLSFNILKDGDGEYWLLRVWMTAEEDSRNLEQEEWHKTDLKARGFTENSPIAVGGEWTSVQFYYAVGGTIYRYNVPARQSFPVSAPGIPPGDIITYLGFLANSGRHYGAADAPNALIGMDQKRFIVVGSFNEGTKVGTKVHYAIPQPGVWQMYTDSRTGQLHRWTGFARIVDVINR